MQYFHATTSLDHPVHASHRELCRCSSPRRISRHSLDGEFLLLCGFLVSLPLIRWFGRRHHEPEHFKFIEHAHNWIPSIGADYHRHRWHLLPADHAHHAAGLDLHPLFVDGHRGSASRNTTRFLILQTGMLGVFMALDFFLFFVFWEAMLVPMYLLIGIWGGPRKLYAAIKFFLYTLAGSVLMLLGNPVPLFPLTLPDGTLHLRPDRAL